METLDNGVDLKRFALSLRLKSRMKRTRIDAVQACGIFIKKHPKLKGTIIEGYCVTSSEKFKHYWVESEDGSEFDIGYELAKIENPDLVNLSFQKTKERPDGKVECDEHNEELFKLYLEEPKKFWKMVQNTC